MSDGILRMVIIGASALGVAGCAGLKPRESYPEVQQLVSDRIAKHVEWYADGDASRAVREQIGQMLAKPLTADDAVQIGLLNNRHLQATYEELGIAQADLVQAGLLKNPVFSGDLKFSTAGGGTRIEVAVVDDFLDLLYIPMRKSIATTELEGAKLKVGIAVIDLASELRTTFYALQGAQQGLEMRRTVVAASAASLELAQRIHDSGNNTTLELATEQAMYEQSKLDLAAAEAEAVDLHEHLTALLGLSGSQNDFTVVSHLPELPAEEVPAADLERRAIDQSLDLKLARGDIAMAEKRLGITKPLGVLSELELGAAAERDPGSGWALGPAFSLPIPLFSQGQPAAAIAAAHLRQAEEDCYALEIDIRSGVRSAYEHMSAARRRAEDYSKIIIPLRKSIVEESQKRFNGMFLSGFQLLQVKRDEIEAGQGYIEALRDYWLARSELDEILAGRFVRSDRPLFSPTLEIKRAQNTGGR